MEDTQLKLARLRTRNQTPSSSILPISATTFPTTTTTTTTITTKKLVLVKQEEDTYSFQDNNNVDVDDDDDCKFIKTKRKPILFIPPHPPIKPLPIQIPILKKRKFGNLFLLSF